jgi:hypothetical protein
VAIYMIGYDLNKSGKNYEGLIEKIQEIADGYFHQLDSTWFIGHGGDAAEIAQTLVPLIDNDDELLVVKLAEGDAAWSGFDQAGSNWLLGAL